jgi:hypothetical protein
MESGGNCSVVAHVPANLSVKTLEEQRQTAEGDFLPTKVTFERFVGLGFSSGADTLVREKRAANTNPEDESLRARQKAKARATAADEGVRSTQANAALHKQIQ